jgi:hypothetical protein
MDIAEGEAQPPVDTIPLRCALQEALELASEAEALVAHAAAALGSSASHPIRLARAHALSLMDELDRILSGQHGVSASR